MTVYHFTSVLHLPWILKAGQLQPGRNQIGGYPVDFLWATTDHRGDGTASAMRSYRKHDLPLVRLTLAADDFELWPDILRRFPQWTPDHIRRLQAAAHSSKDIGCSRVRAEPLSLSRVRAAEAKSYRVGVWKSFELATCERTNCAPQPGHPPMRAVSIGDQLYASAQIIEPGVPTAYTGGRMH